MTDDSKTREVSVRFFRIAMTTPDGEKLVPEFDWPRAHKYLSDQDGGQSEINEHWFTQYQDKSCFAIHRPLAIDFMTRLTDDGTVSDLADETSSDGKPLSVSTFVLPFPNTPYLALSSGAQYPPGKGQLLDFLKEAVPLDEPRNHLKIIPVMGRGKLRMLREKGEITEFRTSFSTQRDLLREIERSQGGPNAIEEDLTHQVDDDVEVEIKVRLTKAGRQRQKSRRNLAEYFMDSTRLFMQPGGKPHAKIYGSDGLIEDVSLVESQLAHKEEVSIAGDRLTFSGLVDAIYSRRHDLQRILDAEVNGG